MDTGENDDLISSDDHVVTKGKYSSDYPGAFRLGVMRRTDRLLLAADYEQGLGSFAGSVTVPRVSAGAEYRLVGWWPLRMGLSVGGGEGANLAWGTGIDLGPFILDLALRNRGITPGGSKGLAFALSSRLEF